MAGHQRKRQTWKMSKFVIKTPQELQQKSTILE